MDVDALMATLVTPGAVLSLWKAGFSPRSPESGRSCASLSETAGSWRAELAKPQRTGALRRAAQKASRSASLSSSPQGFLQTRPSQGLRDPRAHTHLLLAPPQLLLLLPPRGLVMKGAGGVFARERPHGLPHVPPLPPPCAKPWGTPPL